MRVRQKIASLSVIGIGFLFVVPLALGGFVFVQPPDVAETTSDAWQIEDEAAAIPRADDVLSRLLSVRRWDIGARHDSQGMSSPTQTYRDQHSAATHVLKEMVDREAVIRWLIPAFPKSHSSSLNSGVFRPPRTGEG